MHQSKSVHNQLENMKTNPIFFRQTYLTGGQTFNQLHQLVMNSDSKPKTRIDVIVVADRHPPANRIARTRRIQQCKPWVCIYTIGIKTVISIIDADGGAVVGWNRIPAAAATISRSIRQIINQFYEKEKIDSNCLKNKLFIEWRWQSIWRKFVRRYSRAFLLFSVAILR